MATGCEQTNLENTVTLTIRLIRSFEQRNIRFLVLKKVDLDSTVESLIEKINKEILEPGHNLPKPFKTFQYDRLKIEFFAHGAKSSDPVINQDNDLFLSNGQTLREAGVKHESELSFFKDQDYQQYKKTGGITELKYVD